MIVIDTSGSMKSRDVSKTKDEYMSRMEALMHAIRKNGVKQQQALRSSRPRSVVSRERSAHSAHSALPPTRWRAPSGANSTRKRKTNS